MNTLSSLLKFIANRVPRQQAKTYAGEYTIPSSNYLQIDNGTDFANMTILAVTVISWGSNTGAFSLARASGNTIYLIGDAGTIVRDLVLGIEYVPQGGGNT